MKLLPPRRQKFTPFRFLIEEGIYAEVKSRPEAPADGGNLLP
jgi:hypothetical protein